MAIYNAERYIADFIKTIIEDGLDEGQDVCHLDEKSFIDDNDDIITRPTMEEAMSVNKHLISSLLTNHLYDVFISSYKEYLLLEKRAEEREKDERIRLEKSPSFIKGKEDGLNCSPPTDTFASDYVKGYREGLDEREKANRAKE